MLDTKFLIYNKNVVDSVCWTLKFLIYNKNVVLFLILLM